MKRNQGHPTRHDNVQITVGNRQGKFDGPHISISRLREDSNAEQTNKQKTKTKIKIKGSFRISSSMLLYVHRDHKEDGESQDGHVEFYTAPEHCRFGNELPLNVSQRQECNFRA